MATLKTFQYRLYPTKEQQRLLNRQLEECRWLRNMLLAQRKQAGERPSLNEVHSQVLQDVVLRLKKAFDAFFRRLPAGETPCYPRFRGQGRYDSMTFPQVPVGCALDTQEKRLVVSKVGRINLLLHRPLEGLPKAATIRRTATGKWFVSFSCEWKPQPLPPVHRQVGIDVGLRVFAMPTEEDPIENPRFFRGEERALARAQRKHQLALDVHKAGRAALTAQVQAAQPDLDAHTVWRQASQDTGERQAWKERQRRRRVVARVHERIRWRRGNFTHQARRRLVNQYDVIAVEGLSVHDMVANHRLAKSIHDAAWTQFAVLLRSKAEWAGRARVAVNPAYTSQDRSGCGHRKADLTLADRTYTCSRCGLTIDRDRNAARNILARGTALIAELALGRQCLGSP